MDVEPSELDDLELHIKQEDAADLAQNNQRHDTEEYLCEAGSLYNYNKEQLDKEATESSDTDFVKEEKDQCDFQQIATVEHRSRDEGSPSIQSISANSNNGDIGEITVHVATEVVVAPEGGTELCTVKTEITEGQGWSVDDTSSINDTDVNNKPDEIDDTDSSNDTDGSVDTDGIDDTDGAFENQISEDSVEPLNRKRLEINTEGEAEDIIDSTSTQHNSGTSSVLKCEQCGKCYTQKIRLMKHLSTHSGEKPFKCELCGQLFSHSSDLQRHFLTHPGEKPFKCGLCGKCFACYSSLTAHTRSHTGEKPFKCEYCEKSFSQKWALKYHMGTHNREKPFQCLQCGKSFLLQVDLECHIRAHAREKSVKCIECGRCFLSMKGLRRHRNTHTEETPLKCEQCGKCFTGQSNLKKHRKTHALPNKSDHAYHLV